MATAPYTQPAESGARVGREIVNAWGWLITRAPRLAKALEATPGATRTMADVLAGFDLFHRKYGIVDARQMANIEREVTYNEATDSIIIRQVYMGR